MDEKTRFWTLLIFGLKSITRRMCGNGKVKTVLFLVKISIVGFVRLLYILLSISIRLYGNPLDWCQIKSLMLMQCSLFSFDSIDSLYPFLKSFLTVTKNDSEMTSRFFFVVTLYVCLFVFCFVCITIRTSINT